MAGVGRPDDPLRRRPGPRRPGVGKRYEDRTEAAERESYARIAAAAFARGGEDVYPDATGTLRMAFGTVKGYRLPRIGGRGAAGSGRRSRAEVPAFTTFGGLYERSAAAPRRAAVRPCPRPGRRQGEAGPATPFNFVLTADIIGGNSGSPVVNRAGELVGLIFDGNLQSLAWDFRYDDRQARALAVDVRAIVEALRKVYGAPALADELSGAAEK